MILYHGTSEENKDKILKEGFSANYREYGTCVYLAKSKELAWDYGDELVEVFIDDEEITTINANTVNYKPDLENIAFKNGYKAVCLIYPDNKSSVDYTEICVYDLSIIEINK